MGLTWGLIAIGVLCLLAAGIRAGEEIRTGHTQVDYLLQHGHELAGEIEARDRQLAAQRALLAAAEAWMAKRTAENKALTTPDRQAP